MKKILSLLMVSLLVASVCYAATVLDKTEETSPTDDDIMYIINDPAGTAADRKITYGNVMANVNDLTASGTVAAATFAGSGSGQATIEDNSATNEILLDDQTRVSGALTTSDSITVGGDKVLNFVSETGDQDDAQIQVDGTVVMNLTDSGVLVVKAPDGDIKIGEDLTVDGTNIFYKGNQLN